MPDRSLRANPTALARVHAARLTGALASHHAHPVQSQFTDRMERLIDALTREGVPIDRAVMLAGQTARLTAN